MVMIQGQNSKARHKAVPENQPLSDEALLQLIRQKDVDAGRLFIARHGDYVLKICLSKLGNMAEAEEAAQDVFANIWRHAGHWQSGNAKVTSWLYRVAYNRCIDILRKRRPQTDIDAAYDLADEADDGFAHRAKIDEYRLIREAISQLNTQQAQAIELIYFDNMKQYDAAAMLDMSLSAFESTLRRARQKLHQALSHERQNLISI